MKKKLITAVLAVTMAVGMLTGCGSGTGTGKREASGEKLVIWTNMNVEVDTIQKYADEWGEKNGRKVEVIHQSPSVQQFAQAVKSASGPDAVVGIPNDQLADYVNADLTAEVPQDLYADQDFSDAAIQACYVDGKRYAAPLSVETTALFYNTDLVSEVPKTWEELVDQAATDGGVQFDATSIYYDLGFVRACGGYIFKYQDGAYDTADIGLDNEGSVEAYAFINDLCNKYKLITADVTADIARSNFQNGKCAYYIGGPWDIDGFTSAGTKFAVAKMPTFHGQPFVTPVGTQVSFVSNSSKNQDAAWDFISYLMETVHLACMRRVTVYRQNWQIRNLMRSRVMHTHRHLSSRSMMESRCRPYQKWDSSGVSTQTISVRCGLGSKHQRKLPKIWLRS